MSETTEVDTAGLRRLPWCTESGKPAYLSADDPNSLLAIMADTAEAQMIGNARDVLSLARQLIAGEISAHEMSYATQRLAECLDDAIKVADMRGERLGLSDD